MERQQIIIPGLPEHLRAVPFGPDGPDDPDRPQVIQNWLNWAQGVVNHRTWTWAACEGLIDGVDANRQQEIEYFRCQMDPLYCIMMYMSMYETNPDLLKLYPWYREEAGGWLPAIPFEFQCRMIRWMEARSRGDGGARGGYIGKPRRMGATDMMANYALAKWLTQEPYSAKFISRRANLVYDKGNMDAILQRILAKLDDSPGNAPMPAWLVPPGWDMSYVAEMKVMRPDNKNLLGGEATTSTAGRGGRATEGFLDEAAVMEKLGFVIGAIQATVRTLFIASSETVETSEEFVDNKEKAKARNPLLVFEMDYWEHPFQDKEWLKAEEQRYIDAGNHEAFFREILRDARVGFAGWMYEDAQKVNVLSEQGKPNVEPLEHMSGSIDVLMDPGYADETALHWVLMDAPGVPDTVLESYTQKGMPAEYYAAIIAGAHPLDYPEYYFPPEAEELMAWVRNLDKHGMRVRRVCGDPYGRQSRAGPNAQGVDDSWYGRMIRWWEINNPVKDEYGQPRVIPILTNWSVKDARSFQGRRQAMMHWLRSGLQFNDTPQVRQTLLALQRTRWFENEKRITEQKDTYHDIYCVTGDSLVRTLDGYHPIKSLVGRSDVITYAYSERHGRIVPAPVSEIFQSGTQVPVIEVGLDSGESVTCTPNHLFMLRDGSYRRADELGVGDSLMPFYDRHRSGRPVLVLNDGSEAVEHVYVYHWFHGPPTTGWHIHHKDEVKTNNYPSNLEGLHPSDHCRITLKDKHTPEASVRASATARSRHARIAHCGWCGDEFMADWRSVYCSKQCSSRASNAKRNAERERSFIEKSCIICGETFRGAPRRKTCSPDCQDENWRKHTGRSMKRSDGLSGIATNHKVRFIRDAGVADVYDMTVPDYHNFACNGVILHNSHRRSAMEYGAVNREEFLWTAGDRPSEGRREQIAQRRRGDL